MVLHGMRRAERLRRRKDEVSNHLWGAGILLSGFLGVALAIGGLALYIILDTWRDWVKSQ